MFFRFLKSDHGKAFCELEDSKNHFFQVRGPWIPASSRAKTHRASPRQMESSSYISTESGAVSSVMIHGADTENEEETER